MADEVSTDGAIEVTIQIDLEQWQVDVCPTHQVPLSDLAETLSQLGRKVPKRNGKPARQAGEHVCPVCGKPYSSSSNLSSHTRSVHGQSLAEARGNPLDYACEHCERKFSTPQGVAVHASRVHVH